MNAYPLLFAPGAIAGVELKNRIVQTPMGTGLIDMGQVTTREVAFQEERARGGVGLIITGAAVVHPTSRFPARIITEAWDPDGIPALRLRTDAVHRHGAAIFGQLIHLGRESPGGQTDFVPMGPSPIPHERDPGVPHEMSLADIRMIVDGFGTSAANFKSGGYDGVEIHGAHGYLVSQFLSPESNRRTDAYGGSLERRLRILVEIVEEIRARCGGDYPLGVRLSGDDYLPGGLTIDDTRSLAVALQKAAPVDYVSLTTGLRSYYVKDTTFAEGFALEMGALLKSDLGVPLIVAGRIRHPDLAERALAAGQTDFIGIGRAQIADPNWVRKAQEGRTAGDPTVHRNRPGLPPGGGDRGLHDPRPRRARGGVGAREASLDEAPRRRRRRWPRRARGGPGRGGIGARGRRLREHRRDRRAAADSGRRADPR